MPFFLHQNVTKLCKNNANLRLQNYDKNILHFNFFQFCVASNTGSSRSILQQKAEPLHGSQRALNFVGNFHQSQARQSYLEFFCI